MKHPLPFLTALLLAPLAALHATITVEADQRLGRIEPMLYGQFIEHLGGCINGGIFEPGSPLADTNGFRHPHGLVQQGTAASSSASSCTGARVSQGPSTNQSPSSKPPWAKTTSPKPWPLSPPAAPNYGKWHLDGHGRSSCIPPERRQGFDYWKAAECDQDYNRSHYYAGDSNGKKFWDGYDAFAQTKDAQ